MNVILLTVVFQSVSLPNFNLRNVNLQSVFMLIAILLTISISSQCFNCHSDYQYAGYYSIQCYSSDSHLADFDYSDFLIVVVFLLIVT
jgi:hypothetical protein